METVSRALGVLANVDKETLKYFNGMMSSHFGKDFGIPDGAKEKNQGSLKTHPSAAVGAVKEEIHSEIEEMFKDNQLSEEFKEKATVLFEAAVEARVNAERVGLEEEYEARLEDELESINEEIQSHLHSTGRTGDNIRMLRRVLPHLLDLLNKLRIPRLHRFKQIPLAQKTLPVN